MRKRKTANRRSSENRMETNRLKRREGWPRRSAGYDYRDESAYPPIFSVNADISSQRLGANCRPEQVQQRA